jgi:predicted TIM-barrel fold metal-dependent hydrolase
VIPIYSRSDNESVARLVASHPDRFLGWIFLNPRNNSGVLDELKRWRAVPGMIGVKLHPHWHDYRTEILGPVLRRAEELRLPVLIHLGVRGAGAHPGRAYGE